jgi:hypothetical protein
MGVHPPPSPARADFSIMMECTPEIGLCHSVSTLWFKVLIWSKNCRKIFKTKFKFTKIDDDFEIIENLQENHLKSKGRTVAHNDNS